jgi:hypothetical protein
MRKSKLGTCTVHRQEQTRSAHQDSTFKHSCRHAWQSGVPRTMEQHSYHMRQIKQARTHWCISACVGEAAWIGGRHLMLVLEGRRLSLFYL